MAQKEALAGEEHIIVLWGSIALVNSITILCLRRSVQRELKAKSIKRTANQKHIGEKELVLYIKELYKDCKLYQSDTKHFDLQI